MRILALGLAVVALSVWFDLPVHRTKSMSASASQSVERGPVTADIEDSDVSFQNAIRAAAPERDNSQKIDALLKRMTLEQQVRQTTQLTIGMIADGRDHNTQND